MSDDVDIASEREQIARDAALREIQAKKPAAIATGLCLECSAELADGKRWCCADCRDTWQRWNPQA